MENNHNECKQLKEYQLNVDKDLDYDKNELTEQELMKIKAILSATE